MGIKKTLSTSFKKEEIQVPAEEENPAEGEAISTKKEADDLIDEFGCINILYNIGEDDIDAENLQVKEEQDIMMHKDERIDCWDFVMPPPPDHWDGPHNDDDIDNIHGWENDHSSNCVFDDDMGFSMKKGSEQLDDDEKRLRRLNLSLNYQEIVDAWSELCTAPLAADHHESSSIFVSPNNNAYTGEVPVMEEERRRREVSVLRYKEKRQTRFFSKKIRYQVRKLNADKRPRLKGRFVKRIGEKMHK